MVKNAFKRNGTMLLIQHSPVIMGVLFIGG